MALSDMTPIVCPLAQNAQGIEREANLIWSVPSHYSERMVGGTTHREACFCPQFWDSSVYNAYASNATLPHSVLLDTHDRS